MENFVQPHQNTIAQSLDYQTAQLALSTLQKAGFPPEQFSVIPQSLDPNASVHDTAAGQGAQVGALTGGIFGSLMGGLIAYGSNLSTGTAFNSNYLISLVLAGGGLGALAVSILGALTGTNVSKAQDAPDSIEQYILIADVTPEQLGQAQMLLQEKGIPVTPN